VYVNEVQFQAPEDRPQGHEVATEHHPRARSVTRELQVEAEVMYTLIRPGRRRTLVAVDPGGGPGEDHDIVATPPKLLGFVMDVFRDPARPRTVILGYDPDSHDNPRATPPATPSW
jgi:hypothetical protein